MNDWTTALLGPMLSVAIFWLVIQVVWNGIRGRF